MTFLFLSDQHYPLSSDEFEEGTTQRQAYLASMEKLCQLFSATASTQVLQFLVNVCTRENHHPSLDNVASAFTNLFSKVPLLIFVLVAAKVLHLLQPDFLLFLFFSGRARYGKGLGLSVEFVL